VESTLIRVEHVQDVDTMCPDKAPPLTKRQAQIISAYTGTLCCDMDIFVEFVAELVGRDLSPEEFVVEGGLREEVESQVLPMFKEICYGVSSRACSEREDGKHGKAAECYTASGSMYRGCEFCGEEF